MNWIKRVYWWALRGIGIGERRCGWCKKLMGYKRLARVVTMPNVQPVTHGMCVACEAKWIAGMDAAAPRRRRIPRQRTSRKNLRRRTGGWGGAVACRWTNR